MGQQVPNVIEIEKKVLSAMMLKEGEVIPAVSGIITDEDFYREEHRLIFRALLKVHDKGTPPDVLLVEEELRRTNDLNRVKRAYLFSLIDMEFTTARAETYAKEIRDKARARKAIRIAEELAEQASIDREPIGEILARAEQRLQETIFSKGQDEMKLLDLMTQIFEEIRCRKENGGAVNGVQTGLLDLDKVTGGLKKSDLIILAARPSMGKSALAMNMAVAAARKVSTLVFSLEMSKEQLTNRIFSAESRINATRIQNSTLTKEEIESLLFVMDNLVGAELYIDDTSALSLYELRARARRHKQKYGLGLIVIDYIQLIQGSKEYRNNRVQEVSEISRGLKALARELEVPILALSQLNRQVEMRAEKKPQLSDLRESGAIEQDADIVMFLYRDEYYNHDDNEDENIAELIIAKNRNGATCTVRLLYQKEIVRFDNLVKEDF